VVRVWQVVETTGLPSVLAQDGSPGTAAADGGGPGLAKKQPVKGKSGGRDTLPEHLVVPDKMLALAEQPACVLEGHNDDVLDFTWSKSDQVRCFINSSHYVLSVSLHLQRSSPCMGES
jgi:WD repeat-containing protein 44